MPRTKADLRRRAVFISQMKDKVRYARIRVGSARGRLKDAEADLRKAKRDLRKWQRKPL